MPSCIRRHWHEERGKIDDGCIGRYTRHFFSFFFAALAAARALSRFLRWATRSALACRFAFHAAYSRCPRPSAPCRARRTLTGMILQQMACRRKSSRPFCVTWFVPLFFTHLLLTLLPGSSIDLHEVMWSRKFSFWQNIEIYRYL